MDMMGGMQNMPAVVMPPPNPNLMHRFGVSETETDFSSYSTLWPTFLDSTKTIKRGRKISTLDSPGEDITIQDIHQACVALRLPHVIEVSLTQSPLAFWKTRILATMNPAKWLKQNISYIHSTPLHSTTKLTFLFPLNSFNSLYSFFASLRFASLRSQKPFKKYPRDPDSHWYNMGRAKVNYEGKFATRIEMFRGVAAEIENLNDRTVRLEERKEKQELDAAEIAKASAPPAAASTRKTTGNSKKKGKKKK